MKKKTKWSRPKLKVLVRGKTQENVLAACKFGTGSGHPNTTVVGCSGNYGYGCTGLCWQELSS